MISDTRDKKKKRNSGRTVLSNGGAKIKLRKGIRISQVRCRSCEYYGFLGLDPLLNRLDARTSPLLGSPHEVAQGGYLSPNFLISKSFIRKNNT